MTKKRNINSKKFDQTRSHQKRHNELRKSKMPKLIFRKKNEIQTYLHVFTVMTRVNSQMPQNSILHNLFMRCEISRYLEFETDLYVVSCIPGHVGIFSMTPSRAQTDFCRVRVLQTVINSVFLKVSL